MQFFLLDASQLSQGGGNASASAPAPSDAGHEATVLDHKKKELYKLLLQEFSDLPKAENMDLDNYGVVNVAPSVVPTYLPSFRIFVYNATGEPYLPGHLGVGVGVEDEDKDEEEEEEEAGVEHGTRPRSMRDVAGALCDDAAYARTWRCQLTQPWHSSARAPSRRNMLWTPLGYAQVRARLG